MASLVKSSLAKAWLEGKAGIAGLAAMSKNPELKPSGA